MLDHDACKKLAAWFDDRWNDHWCLDISAELVNAIEESWAREVPLPPYHIYINIAYHLAQEARAGLAEFRIPPPRNASNVRSWRKLTWLAGETGHQRLKFAVMQNTTPFNDVVGCSLQQ